MCSVEPRNLFEISNLKFWLRQWIRRSPVISSIFILLIAMAIGGVSTMEAVMRGLKADPVPGRSHQIFHVQLDPRPARGYRGGDAYHQGVEPPPGLTWQDAQALSDTSPDVKAAALAQGRVPVRSDMSSVKRYATARYLNAAAFALFDMPIWAGRPWTKQEEARRDRVVVISRRLAEEMYSGNVALGKLIQIAGKNFEIVGILNEWNIYPRFYDLASSGFNVEDIFVPLPLAIESSMPVTGSIDCFGPQQNDLRFSPCTWLQYWVELPDNASVSRYKDVLHALYQSRRELGLYDRPENWQLRTLQQWIEQNIKIPLVFKIQTIASYFFLLACLINCSGLLFVMFHHRKKEVGIKRALGATRSVIVAEFISESSALGIFGATLGVLFGVVGVFVMRCINPPYANYFNLNLGSLCIAAILAIAMSILSSLWPAINASKVDPASAMRG
ncbi:hypothetical protein NB699_001431 [Xanthomonas sacchari]|nr:MULTISPECIES: ABC transporter permease [Xanthomonas]KAB7779008.1 hypothetical protein CEK66_07400 [Xanthomonas sp. LMG 12460]MCW0366448.1 hypothetical protein [Xanthomonas sacchari]MCW0440527.1 hypothetical protein [Xanthomonas sacchari]